MKKFINQRSRSIKLIAIVLSLLLVISISSTSVLAAFAPTFSEREPNNSIVSANRTGYNLSQTSELNLYGKIGYSSDQDYYSFTISKPQVIELKSIWINVSIRDLVDDLIIQLYAADGQFIDRAVYRTVSDRAQIFMRISLTPGTYYIQHFARNEYQDSYVGESYLTNILVMPDSVDSIKVSQLPAKTNYIKGEGLDLSGGEILINDTFNMSMSEATISGFNSNSKEYGPQTLTVEYGGATTSFTVYLNPFYDVPFAPKTHDFYYTIQNIVSKGIMRGKGDGKYFGTADKLTRAEASVALVRAAGLEPARGSAFSDVPRNHWANAYINAAAKAGIVNGKGPGRFAPNDNITRAELAVMVSRAFKLQKDSSNVKNFRDVPSSHWAYNFINNLTSNGIVGGYPDGRFGPEDPVTRGQFTVFVSKSMNKK